MTKIELHTEIKAPLTVCFDLSRSVELHQLSTAHTDEKAVAGRQSGLCEKGDTITWRAKHFGSYRTLQVRLTILTYPIFFEDQMVKGAFKSLKHQHYFREAGGVTHMYDIFKYETPYGLLGKVFNGLVLRRYMTRLLLQRNRYIREVAENGKWREIIRP
ncbi:SRPBCC family protein [Paraflavisolibacter sp. H34]|uniref:SRPBCC family protein n=1 Tax=Huijunlia imazamoxiresistens TaxID=3127457 RepID=UPI0030158DF4